MNHLERFARLVSVYLLIKQGKTGSPSDIAKKMRICRSQFYNIKEELEDYGAIIKYSRKLNTFYYDNNFELRETAFWKNEVEVFLKKLLSVQGYWTEGQ